jgi:hypothetical protein
VWVTTLILGLLTLVLVIVCANVTILLLSRAAARRREIAVGFPRRRLVRLVRMLLTESLIPCAAGAIAGWMSRRSRPASHARRRARQLFHGAGLALLPVSRGHYAVRRLLRRTDTRA